MGYFDIAIDAEFILQFEKIIITPASLKLR